MRKYSLALSLAAAAGLLIAPMSADAAACRDTKGKFIKCPPVKAPVKRCRDTKGHFKKC